MNTKELDLSFEVIKKESISEYSAGCKTNGSSGCCTTYCTRDCNSIESESSMNAWDKYLQVNAGVLQY